MCSYEREEQTTMKTVVDEAGTNRTTEAERDTQRRQEEEEVARKIEKGINDMKAAVSEKVEDGVFAAERLLRQGRYAIEDGLSELTHTIKRNPLGYMGIAFAAGALVGLLISLAAKRSEGQD